MTEADCPNPYKRRFATKREAKRHCKRIRHATGDKWLQPYLCECGWHHIGHKSTAPERRKTTMPEITNENELAAPDAPLPIVVTCAGYDLPWPGSAHTETTEPPAAPAKRKTGFYIVWTPGGRNPRQRHDTYEAARAESDRLAKLHPGQRFFAMKCKYSACHAPDGPPPPEALTATEQRRLAGNALIRTFEAAD